jgi:hypothetical protein
MTSYSEDDLQRQMDNFVSTETALYIINVMIGITFRTLFKEEQKSNGSMSLINKLKEELRHYHDEKRLFYSGDKNMQDKFLNVYADRIKQYYKDNGIL